MVVQAAARHLIKLCKLIPLPSKLLLGLASSLSHSLSPLFAGTKAPQLLQDWLHVAVILLSSFCRCLLLSVWFLLLIYSAQQMVIPTRKAQALKLRPKELVNDSHERTMMSAREQPCIELLPSISPIEKSKMGRTKPVVKRDLGNKEGAVAVKKIDAMYKPSGKENIFLATNVKTLAEKSSLRNEENYLIQKCRQLEEMRRNINFNNCVKTAAKETSAAAAAPAATMKPLSSDCDSCAAIAPHDEASDIATGWENATAEKGIILCSSSCCSCAPWNNCGFGVLKIVHWDWLLDDRVLGSGFWLMGILDFQKAFLWWWWLREVLVPEVSHVHMRTNRKRFWKIAHAITRRYHLQFQ